MRENKESEKGGSLIRMYNVGEHYKILQKVGRGTYGTVYKARGLRDNKFYAIKKLENNDVKLQQQGFPITALREITLLKQIDHPNIIKLKEIILSRPSKRNLYRGSTFLVFQYMDHDFAGLFKMRRKFNLPEIKCIFKQLLEGVAYLHRNKILHRDIKSANILVNDDGEVKLADFGLGRKVRLENVFTYKVVTLWYRAPQLLWGFKHYSEKIDVWSIGCVAVEFFTGEVLFKKESQHAQIQRIYEICGDFEANDLRISEEAAKSYQYLADMRPKKAYKKDIANYLRKMSPHISEITIEFIESLLNLDPNKRLSCEEALRHPFFNEKPTACLPRDIEKQEYECHEMFKDRSIKIQRIVKAEPGKIKNSGRDERGYRQYHSKRDKENSMTSQSKNRQFSSSPSSSSNEESQSFSNQNSKRSSRSKSRSARKRSKSREDRDSRSRRHGYQQRKHRQRDDDSRRERNYHREIREERKDRRDDIRDYKLDKDRRIEEKEDKYYRQKNDKHYKGGRRKDDRYNRFDERNDERRDGKDDRRTIKDDHREDKHERRPQKDDRREIKEDRRQMKDERRQKQRREKDERRQKQERRQKDQRREKDDRREKDERRDKEDRREKEGRRNQRHDYKRQSKQKKQYKYQKTKYDSRPYDSKMVSKVRTFQDQKDYKRRQQRRLQRRQERDKGREDRDIGHQNGKYQASKQKYNDYRSGKKSEKFMLIRQKGHRKKQGSSSSSGSSYSSHHFKKQKQHRSKYSYDRKPYYKKQHSSSGSRGYH